MIHNAKLGTLQDFHTSTFALEHSVVALEHQMGSARLEMRICMTNLTASSSAPACCLDHHLTHRLAQDCRLPQCQEERDPGPFWQMEDGRHLKGCPTDFALVLERSAVDLRESTKVNRSQWRLPLADGDRSR